MLYRLDGNDILSRAGHKETSMSTPLDSQITAFTPQACETGASIDGPALVRAVDVTRRYGEGDAAVDALRGVSLDLAAGQFTAVMGPSGSGKSTLMHVLAGLDDPTGGSVTIDGVEITTLKDRQLTQLRRDKVGFIFQTFNLLPMLTAIENIELPMKIAGREVEQEWLDTLVAAVDLGDRLGHRPSEMSGGQQQRVAIARALISRPAVIFADEPTGNLDSHSGDEVLALLRRSADEFGQTIVMVTHDARAATSADRIVFLQDGLIVLDCGRMGRDEIYDTIKSLEATSEDGGPAPAGTTETMVPPAPQAGPVPDTSQPGDGGAGA
jgi:putative ABC transport system ATP-binding protein